MLVRQTHCNGVSDCKTFGMPTVASDHRLLLISMRLRLAATPKADLKPRRDWSVLKNEDRQQEFVREITKTTDLNTCTYSELCNAVKQASESIPCMPRRKKRCPWVNDTVEEARRDLVEAKRRSRSQPSSAHAEAASVP